MFHHGVQQNIVNMRELNSWFRYFSNTNMNNEIKNDKDKTIPMYIIGCNIKHLMCCSELFLNISLRRLLSRFGTVFEQFHCLLHLLKFN